jgi:hypothetical protein
MTQPTSPLPAAAGLCEDLLDMRPRIPALLLTAALACAGCNGLECEGLRVDVVNSDQSLQAVQMIGPDEFPGQDKLLHPGEQRRIVPCLRVGDRQRFRVLTADGSETLATANCVVSRSGDNIQGAVARVVWDLRGLACENW